MAIKLKLLDITEIKNYVIRKTYVKKDEFDSDFDIINVKNGLLNWKTRNCYHIHQTIIQ